MASRINDDQKAPIVVMGTDDQGNPVPGAPVVVLTSSDPTIFTIDVTDPAAPLFMTTGKLGAAQIQGLAKLPDGTVITGLEDVTVDASALARISISLGAAVPR
jgi:hypothetical protein